ncbi:MAG: ATP-binding protein, partial [Psychrosphaera sp.]|nr:ATP-binding protein [Psychrosphaera sp.]
MEAVREAQVATATKAEFLAKMSHEIRTPMHGVLGMAELLEKSPLSDVQHSQVKIIVNSGTMLLTIINDILDFSKLEAGLVTLESIEFNLEHTIHDVMTLLAASIQYDHLELVLDYPADTPRHFKGDPARIRQILNNLVGNAIKFTERGIILVKVYCQPLENDFVQVYLTVQDSGIGIREDKIEGLFSSFSQADNSTTRKYGGTGLGLSICKQLIEVMGGKISVNSVLGEGSIFGIEVALIESASPSCVIQKDLHDCRILLVVDNSLTRELYLKLLTNLGVETTIIDHCEAIIRTLNTAQNTTTAFDIVIIDDNLTDKAGLDVGKQIRANKAFDPIKLMILTSFASRGDAQCFAEAGFDAYLTKPVLAENFTDSLIGLMQSDQNQSDQNKSAQNNKQLITQHSIAESKLQHPEHFNAHILLVEDIEINQLVAKHMLEGLGLTMDIVDNGLQAVAHFQQRQQNQQRQQKQKKQYDLI